jgi:hypothetical protein
MPTFLEWFSRILLNIRKVPQANSARSRGREAFTQPYSAASIASSHNRGARLKPTAANPEDVREWFQVEQPLRHC